MKAVLFDLDNTLYPEIDFVKSGFRTAARYLHSRYEFNEDTLITEMIDIMQRDGRGKIFNRLLQDNGLYTKERVSLLVYLYRTHRPNIRLYPDALQTLKLLKRHKMLLGMVTDGMASIQRKKIAALGLESLFDVIICSDELGRECWKPSPVPYTVALELLGVSPSEASYVGDDPLKDFLAPKSMGMLTIMVKRRGKRTAISSNTPVPEGFSYTVKRLEEIIPIIMGEL